MSQSTSKKPQIIALLGPTAVGKTAISLRLAEKFGGEIVSTDSRLFYRGMDIGTAKPTIEERARVPHHLIDIRNPDQTYSLADFQRDAYTIIDEVLGRDRLPILVGGTGQYLRALTEGWQIPEQQADPRLRAALTDWGQAIGAATLHQRLGVLDPQAAQTIEPHNLRRTVRALEVIFHTGKKFSAQRRKRTPRYDVVQVGLMRERARLYARIDERVTAMIGVGLIEEVRALLGAGYAPDLPAFSAIGYGEVIRYLDGEIAQDEITMLMKRRTRVLVRRQANWFKRGDAAIKWFDLDQPRTTEIEKWISDQLGDG